MKRFFASRDFELQTRMPTPPNSEPKQKQANNQKLKPPPAKKEKTASKNNAVPTVPSNSSLGVVSVDPQNFVCAEDIEKDD